jgi:hypothetical protein
MHTVSSANAVLIQAVQSAGDWSDAPTPDLLSLASLEAISAGAAALKDHTRIGEPHPRRPVPRGPRPRISVRRIRKRSDLLEMTALCGSADHRRKLTKRIE